MLTFCIRGSFYLATAFANRFCASCALSLFSTSGITLSLSTAPDSQPSSQRWALGSATSNGLWAMATRNGNLEAAPLKYEGGAGVKSGDKRETIDYGNQQPGFPGTISIALNSL